jgi:hypothetical protein
MVSFAFLASASFPASRPGRDRAMGLRPANFQHLLQVIRLAQGVSIYLRNTKGFVRMKYRVKHMGFLACLGLILSSGVGCKTSWQMPGKDLFSFGKKPSEETLAGKGPTTTYPASPASKYSPQQVASAPNGANQQAMYNATAPAGSTAPAGYSAASANPVGSAAAANGYAAGYPTGPYGTQASMTRPASLPGSTAAAPGMPGASAPQAGGAGGLPAMPGSASAPSMPNYPQGYSTGGYSPVGYAPASSPTPNNPAAALSSPYQPARSMPPAGPAAGAMPAGFGAPVSNSPGMPGAMPGGMPGAMPGAMGGMSPTGLPAAPMGAMPGMSAPGASMPPASPASWAPPASNGSAGSMPMPFSPSTLSSPMAPPVTPSAPVRQSISSSATDGLGAPSMGNAASGYRPGSTGRPGLSEGAAPSSMATPQNGSGFAAPPSLIR